MRLISADEAYKVLTEYYYLRTETQLKALTEALGRVPTVEERSKGKWIPCSERLPEVEDEMYLVTNGSRTVEMRWFSKDLYNIDPEKFKDKKGESGWYYYDSTWGFVNWDDIIAWMPLPRNYEEV